MIQNRMLSLALMFLLAVAATSASAAEKGPYVQHEDVVYGQEYGVALVMDIFVPTGEKNGVGIVDVVSGAWHSDRGKIRQHKMAQMYDIFTKKGFTVFAVRPGSITKFSAGEMLQNIKQGVRWVKAHAEEYGVDPDNLGMTGASAGGHLACLASVTAHKGEKSDGTDVKATAIFFPPTDFTMYGTTAVDPKGDDRFGQIVRALAFRDGIDGLSDEEITKKIEAISPAKLVHKQVPAFLFIHGDADPAVPLQQSEVMVEALENAGVEVKLIVKPGGGHPWPTIHEEVAVLADWLESQLVKQQ
ncbi:alpha/beta hydrolase [Symmachiella dynata]|uniref:alpha/beta hydrolase n=1 Tax=Symmachiella dynata TaxID=2527995 RepID=UPI0030EDB015